MNLFNKIASFRSQKHQVDVYYSPAGESFYNSGDRCLRVRTEDGNTLLSYKRIYDENTSKQFIEEYETRVESFDMVDHILKGLCFRREIIVDKLRTEYSMDAVFLISLDKVDGLGYFIEIENRNETDTLEKRNHDLYEFARQLQVDITHRNTEGYSNMLQVFSVIDDCFLTDKEKAIEICDYIASKNLGLQWSLAARVDSINDEVLSSLKKSGCIEIKFGVETGSDELLKKMNKCETVADAEAAIKMTKSYGIGVKLFIITGLPFETDTTHQETKDFLSKMQPYIDRVSLLRYTPLAGSYIYSQPEKFGIKKSTLTRDNFNKTSLYRRSFDWWKDNMRYKNCERWYKDMSKFIEDRWGDA